MPYNSFCQLTKMIKMFKVIKYSIFAGVFLVLTGCTKATVKVTPSIEKKSFNE